MNNKYGKEIFEFIKKNVTGKSNLELLELANKKFNNLFTLSKLKAFKKKHNLSSGLTGRFEKGQISHNKGKKMPPEIYEKCKSTMFKKGHVAYNHKPIGSERINRKDNCIIIKTAPNKWEYKQRYIWEQETGEKIPKGHVVIFLDGNRRNFALDNLALITKNENVRLNQKGMRNNNPDITKANINIVRLDNRIRELRKNEQRR